MDRLGALGLAPLSARSALLSLLLGSHPAAAPVGALVRLGELLDLSEGSVRVALSRLAADGDVVTEAGRYRLAEGLLERQAALDRGRTPALRPWRGRWELAALAPDLDAAGRATVEATLGRLRLAPWREGVWLRPANLDRPWPAELAPICLTLPAGPVPEPAALAARLWDLAAWAGRAGQLLDALAEDPRPAVRFVVAAAVARHLREDPVLPTPLLPRGWPGARLRAAYTAYEVELAALLVATASGGRLASARHSAT